MNIVKKPISIKGFTLVEVLVVFSIIGVLTTAVLGAVNGARSRAKMSRLATQFREIEKAFLYTYLDENRNDFWTETELGMTNPTISDLIAIESGPMATFSEHMPRSPSAVWGEWGSAEYNYDWDGGPGENCAGNQGHGVNIMLVNLVKAQRRLLDVYIDGEDDPECGKVLWKEDQPSVKALWYRISDDGEW